MNYQSYLASFLFLTLMISANAQNIDQLLQETAGSNTQYTTATFKSTRIINGQSIERMPKGQLDVRISHRFGQLNMGAYNFWGLDQANTHFSLELGITNWVMMGLGRGNYEKTYDGFLKFSLFRQSKGKRNMPVSISWLSTAALNTLKWDGPGELYFFDRLSYVQQLLVARKLSESISVEINPTFVHRNLIATELDPNDLWSVGMGSRVKISKRVSINFEYYYVVPPVNDYRSQKTYNPLSVGFDIETGGHVFQLFLTNSVAMIEKGFIGETTDRWVDGGIHFGFNISRVFTVY